MKLQEIKELSDMELKEMLDVEKLSLNQLVISHSITPLDNPSILKEKRKDIARINTEIRVREINKA
ncbi:MAG: 50S ribosomal protein L29 [Crocinitomicaceae bacterium]